MVPAATFDNVTGRFPIGFFVWNTAVTENFSETKSDMYDANTNHIGTHTIICPPKNRLWMDWVKTMHDKHSEIIGHFRTTCSDFQNQNGTFITSQPSSNDILQRRTHEITINNFASVIVAFAVRMSIDATWYNDRDQFLYPDDDWQADRVFQTDCLVYTLFSNANNIRSNHGINHWIPFTEQEVGAQDNFASHFMSDYLHEKHVVTIHAGSSDLFSGESEQEETGEICPLDYLSSEAKAVMDAGRELWRYYHSQENANPNASYYDIRLHFQGTKITKSGKEQMNSDSTDETYTNLHNALRQAMRKLAAHIEPKVYQYGFLK